MSDERYKSLPPSGAEQGLICASSPRPQGSEELLLLRAFLLCVIAPLALCIGAVVVICAYLLLVV